MDENVLSDVMCDPLKLHISEEKNVVNESNSDLKQCPLGVSYLHSCR